MQSTTVNPVTNTTTFATLGPTKSREQILIQSSGAMIAIIVIGVFIILTVLLIILKTYHRCTHTSRLMGTRPKSRTKSSSTAQTNMNLGQRITSSVSGGVAQSPSTERSSFRLPRAELPSLDRNNLEQRTTTSDSTVVTIHSAPPLNT